MVRKALESIITVAVIFSKPGLTARDDIKELSIPIAIKMVGSQNNRGHVGLLNC